jgi:3-(3-hydroxy-phenyl)propionate hydroxylase
VVGLGPVGATVSALLAQRGLSVAAFDREKSVYHMPRAAHFDAEIMRVWQQLGVARALADCTVSMPGMHLVNAEGKTLVRFEGSLHEGPLGWPTATMFYQPDLERALRARAAELGVAMHVGCEVASVDPGSDDGATPPSLCVRDVDTGAVRDVRAAWVLGCDGARSLVRSAVGAELEDLECDQPWLVIDAILRRPVELPEVAVQYCNPSRPATFVPMPGARRRWEFMLMPGDTRESIERPERVHELLSPWLSPEDAEIERATVYTFHACLASKWRHGRTLLLGDSAHQMPPFLGQGMCAGVRDAANLAWKLDLVHRGLASPALLDTYEQERSPHVRTVIQLAVTTGNIIQTTDPVVAAARDVHFLAADASGARPEGIPPLAPVGVFRGDDPAAGHILPQPRGAGGALLDERLGDGFALIGTEDPRRWLSCDGASGWERIGARVVAAPELEGWLARHEAIAVAVRPDRYVFGVARSPGELDELGEELRRSLVAA